MTVNPLALLFIAFFAVGGLLLGSWLIGLFVGLTIVLAASLTGH